MPAYVCLRSECGQQAPEFESALSVFIKSLLKGRGQCEKCTEQGVSRPVSCVAGFPATN